VNYVYRNKNRKMIRASVELTDANELLINVDYNSLFQLKEQQLEKALEIITPEDKMIVLSKYQDDLSIKGTPNHF
jgi:DTW domain-containing protein YfiP